jgi:hypothetical protein
VTCEQAHHGDLALAASALDDAGALALVHLPRFATDVSLIDFDVTADLREGFVLYGEAQPVEHEPAGFLGDAKVARQFVAADAVLTVDEHPQRWEPLVEADRRILEQTTDLDRELFLAASALPDHAGFQEGDFLRFAMRACDAVRPTECRHKVDGDFLITKNLTASNRVSSAFSVAMPINRPNWPVCQVLLPKRGITVRHQQYLDARKRSHGVFHRAREVTGLRTMGRCPN